MLQHLALFVVTAIIYLVGSRDNQLTLDDAHTILRNPIIQSKSFPSIDRLLTTDYWGTPLTDSHSHQSFRPITTFTFYLDAGGDPSSSKSIHNLHRTNIFIHSCVVMVVVVLLTRLGIQKQNALLGSLFFAIHPIVTESVANVTGRAELLAALFGISYYLLATTTFASTTSTSISLSTLFSLSFPCALLATFSKEVGFASTIIVIFHFSIIQPSLKGTVLATVVSMLVGALRLHFLHATPTFSIVDNPLSNASLSFQSKLLSTSYVNIKSIGFLLNPFSTLCADYSGAGCPIITHILDYRNLVTFCFAILFGCFIYSSVKRLTKHYWYYKPIYCQILLAFLWWVVPQSLASNIFLHVGFCIAERSLYSPLIGAAIGFALLLQQYFQIIRNRKNKATQWILNGLLLALFVTMTSATIARSRVWSSNLKLWSSAEQNCVASCRILNNFGKAHQRNGDLAISKNAYLRAIAIQPNAPLPYFNLGMVSQKQNACTTAIQYYKQAVKLHPQHIASWNNMGACALQMRDKKNAIKYFTKGLGYNPDDVGMKKNLEVALGL